MNPRLISLTAGLALGVAASVASPSFAQAPAADAAANGTAAPLDVRLALGQRSLDRERVRAALERELGKPVALSDADSAPLVLSVGADGRLTARYSRPAEPELVRQVDLPADDERAVEVIALLAGNLTRDEASELIDALNAEAPPPEAPPAPPAPLPPPPPPARTYETSPSVNLSLFHPLTVVSNSEEHEFALELGLAYGNVGAISGFGAEFGVLHIGGPLNGVGLGMFWTKVGGPIDGVSASLGVAQGNGGVAGAQLAGLVALQKGKVDGAQLAVGVAIAQDVVGMQGSAGLSVAKSLQGFQGSAGVSIVRGDAEGVVGAGGVSVADGDVDGLIGASGAAVARNVQGAILAGGFTVARDVEGVQGSAGVNVAHDAEGVLLTGAANVAHDVDGAMLTAGVNVAHDLEGVSIAPVNIATGRVDGLQLGIVNVASEVHGAAIGIISIAGNGHVQPSFWTSSELPLHTSVKFVAGYAYSELGIGLDRENVDGDRWVMASEGGVGAHVPFTDWLALEPGVHFSEVFRTSDFQGSLEDNLHYRLRATFRLGWLLEVFAGGGARHGLGGRTKGEVVPEVLAGVSLF
jgi:hypothetical protein